MFTAIDLEDQPCNENQYELLPNIEVKATKLTA